MRNYKERFELVLTYFLCLQLAFIPRAYAHNKSLQHESESTKQFEPSTIEQAQIKLNQFGIDLEVNGLLNIQTRRALKLFQQQKNLIPSGELNIKSLQALGVEYDGLVGVPSSMNPNEANTNDSSQDETNE